MPQRRQIGAALDFPSGLSGLPQDGRGGGGGLALGPLGRSPFPPSGLTEIVLPKRGRQPTMASRGTTTG